MNLRNFNRYKANLMYDNEYIYSYRTKVAKIENGNLIVDNWFSVTTSKHINYAANELRLKVIKKY
jgi:hypothetical protein